MGNRTGTDVHRAERRQGSVVEPDRARRRSMAQALQIAALSLPPPLEPVPMCVLGGPRRIVAIGRQIW